MWHAVAKKQCSPDLRLVGRLSIDSTSPAQVLHQSAKRYIYAMVCNAAVNCRPSALPDACFGPICTMPCLIFPTRWAWSIASCAVFCSSNLIHLRDPLLELCILAFLVAVSFVLSCTRQPPCGCFSISALPTSHFHGRYHSLTLHLFNGIRRWAQLSR